MEEDAVPMVNVLELLNARLPPAQVFSAEEAQTAAQIMTDANEVMFVDDMLYRI